MLTVKYPYEWLTRWDQQGALSGSQVQYRFVTRDDSGATVGEFLGPAEPLTLNGAEGFPLGDIASKAQADALVAAGEADRQRDAALAALAKAEADRDEALARVSSLEAELAALRPAP